MQLGATMQAGFAFPADQEVADGVPVAFVVTGKHSDGQLIMDARQREPSVVRERNFEDHNLPL